MQCGVRGSWTLFFPLQPRLSRGMPKPKKKNEKIEVDSLHCLYVVAVQHGSTLRSHCVSIQEGRKMREREVGG